MSDYPNLDIVREYAKNTDVPVVEALGRYAATSAEFAAVGGTLGSVVPGVGTALGAMVGGAIGAGAQLIDDIGSLFGDEPKRKRTSPEDAEQSFYIYQALGEENETGLTFPRFQQIWIASGRPSVDVLLAARKAESEAARLLRNAPPPPPPPPPPFPKEADDMAKNARAQQSTSRTRREIQVLVQVPSGLVQTGRFVQDPRGEAGFLLDLSAIQVQTLNGKWVRA